MCYADPGSRCFTHGKEDFENKEKEFTEATMIAVKTGAPEAEEKAEKAKAKMLDAETKMYASKEGLTVLKEKLDKQVVAGEISRNYADGEYRRIYGVHHANMLAYDKIHHTVNGRKPSKDWSNENIEALHEDAAHRQRQIKLLAQMKRAGTLRPGDAEKAVKLEAEQNLAWDRVKQAEDTARHLQRGILTASDAPVRGELPKVATKAVSKETKPKKAPVATKKAPAKVEPHLPAKPQEKEYGRFTGALYERSRTNQQVASATRQDLKKAVATNAISKDYQYKVTNRGSTIEINVIGKHDNNIDSYAGAHGGQIKRVSENGRELQNKVSAYASQYTYNHSNAQYDNYNQSHSIFVNFIDSDTGKDVRHS